MRSLRSLTSLWEVSPHRHLSREFQLYQAKSERWTSQRSTQQEIQSWNHHTSRSSGRSVLSISSQIRRTANKSAQTASLIRQIKWQSIMRMLLRCSGLRKRRSGKMSLGWSICSHQELSCLRLIAKSKKGNRMLDLRGWSTLQMLATWGVKNKKFRDGRSTKRLSRKWSSSNSRLNMPLISSES